MNRILSGALAVLGIVAALLVAASAQNSVPNGSYYDLNAVGRGVQIIGLQNVSQCNIASLGPFVATITVTTSTNAAWSNPKTVATITSGGNTLIPLGNIGVYGMRIQTTSYTSGDPFVNPGCTGGSLVSEAHNFAAGGGTGSIDSVNSGNSIIVNNTDPANPIVNLAPTPQASTLTLSPGAALLQALLLGGTGGGGSINTGDGTNSSIQIQGNGKWVRICDTSGTCELTVRNTGAVASALFVAVAPSATPLWQVDSSGNQTNYGLFNLPSLSDGLLNVASGVVGSTTSPTLSGLAIPSIASAPCVGTDSGGHLVSAACPSPGPFNAGPCIGIVASPAPATISFTCASPTPEPSPIAGPGITVTGGSAPYTISAPSPTPGPCPTAGANMSISGSAMPNCSFASVTPTPAPTPSPAPTIPAFAATSPLSVTTIGGTVTYACSSCAPATLHVKLAIALGFAPGALNVGTVYPYQQVVAYTSGEITGLRVACATNDNGTSQFTVTDVTASTTIGSITMTNGSLTASSTLGSAYTLTTGHVLHLTNPVAGTATSCGVVAEGQQAAY